jgi:hypothetical protein
MGFIVERGRVNDRNGIAVKQIYATRRKAYEAEN